MEKTQIPTIKKNSCGECGRVMENLLKKKIFVAGKRREYRTICRGCYDKITGSVEPRIKIKDIANKPL